MIKVRVRVLGVGLGLIIPTCRANLVLRVIWQCDIYGMTLAPSQSTVDWMCPESEPRSIRTLVYVKYVK